MKGWMNELGSCHPAGDNSTVALVSIFGAHHHRTAITMVVPTTVASHHHNKATSWWCHTTAPCHHYRVSPRQCPRSSTSSPQSTISMVMSLQLSMIIKLPLPPPPPWWCRSPELYINISVPHPRWRTNCVIPRTTRALGIIKTNKLHLNNRPSSSPLKCYHD